MSKPSGTHCNYGLFKIEVGELSAGARQTILINVDERVGDVAVNDAATALNGIRGPSGVLVGPDYLVPLDDIFSTQHLRLDEFNLTCELPSGGRWVTYFSESPNVNACSTEGDKG
uniref:Uncharacterized protein n=1 Tax=Mycobacterium sp. (strain KMS) TaxID=189918 RepID=A1UB64_MYCSK